ncbi:MAG: peptide chain release factor N(5)-glutamine methyltransferase [Patescibacteria group bacterium]
MAGKIQLYTIRDLLLAAEKRLRPKKIRCATDADEGWLDAEVLMAFTLKKDRSWIIAHGTDCLSPYLESQFFKLVLRREQREPIAYIIGHKDFYGRSFLVNPHVLIPRPETELIIDECKRLYRPSDRFLFLDIGTGSGAIAVTVAKEFPRSQIIASDISPSAITVAKKNAAFHRVTNRVTFVQGDLLDKKIINTISKQPSKKSSPLIIAVNPPYLPDKNRTTLEPDVVAYEPDQALFSSKDGLDAIRRLFDQVSDRLNVLPDLLLCEFDTPQSKTIKQLAKNTFPTMNVRIIKDLAKRDRLLKISQQVNKCSCRQRENLLTC